SPAKVGDVDVDVINIGINGDGAPISLNIRFQVGQKDHLIHGLVVENNGKDGAGKDAKFRLDLTYDLVDTSPTFAAADFTFIPPPGAKPAVPATAKPGSAHK